MSIQSKDVKDIFQYDQQQLSTTILYFQTFKKLQVSNYLVTQQDQIQKKNLFIEYINDIIIGHLNSINKVVQTSTQIFKSFIQQQDEIQYKLSRLQLQNQQKSTIIQNNNYIIKRLEQKLNDREIQITQKNEQNRQILQRIDNLENRFKRQSKQLRKTFMIYQEETQEKIQINQQIHSNYQIQKQQNQILREQIEKYNMKLKNLQKEIQQLSRDKQSGEKILNWQVKTRISRQQDIKEKQNIIHRLLIQIDDLKSHIKQNNSKIILKSNINQLEENRKDSDDDHIISSFITDNHSEDQEELRGSFNFTGFQYAGRGRKPSLTQSFQGNNPTQTHSISRNNSSNLQKGINKNQLVRENISTQNNEINIRQWRKSDHESPIEQTSSLTNEQRSSNRYNEGSNFSNHTNIQNSVATQEFYLSTISEREVSLQQSGHKVKRPMEIRIPDLYEAHFLLTSQAVKIRQDIEEVLNIDMKPYYKQIIQYRIPMHQWDQWIKRKLKQIFQSSTSLTFRK